MIFSYFGHAKDYVLSKVNLLDDKSVRHFAFFLMAFVVMALPGDVWAQSNQVADVVCNIVEVLQGDVARGVAAFGIIFLGFSLFLGKISWGVALALGIGIGAIFGANQIVGLIAGDGTDACA